ncbi:MAG TPA: 16S rRNA (cytosine(1402)-N(4))-methyltransferase RsmH [Thermotogota bacterium]|nr:16S rRNA (cytosine(1402)-N(4))-methyltransferase RsmH [Thermotogota bacterium]
MTRDTEQPGFETVGRENPPQFHVPVMVQEVTEGLITNLSGTYIDCTFGEGGHTLEILKRIAPHGGKVIGIDKDLEILHYAEKRLKAFEGSYELFHGHFMNIDLILRGMKVSSVSGVLFDLGVSSYQLNTEMRGFSFDKEGPLDMRMDLQSPMKAEEVINRFKEAELEKLIREYGEEPFSRSIAKQIVLKRPIQTTRELVDAIKAAIPVKVRWKMRKHFATRTFQAFRIYVNRELEELENGLAKSLQILGKGGRIISISFHSLEDRIVKNFFRSHAGKQDSDSVLKIITKKPLVPSEEEVLRNRRARSAKLRIAEKL